jgi:hypothetical protein
LRHKARGAGVKYLREENLECLAKVAALKIVLLEHNSKLIREKKAVEK